MAHEIDQLSTPPPRVTESRFDAYLDGRKWRLSIPDDAKDERDLEHLRRNLYRRGKKLGKRVRVVLMGTYLDVQALTT